MVALLDVNVLIALLWPSHTHHEAAHAWFATEDERRWATCPMTEMAFVRIVSNPSFSRDSISPQEALGVLEENFAGKGHEFWPDDLSLSSALVQARTCLQGHRQLVDAYLLALAHRRGGVLATFDAGLSSLAVSELASALEVVPHDGRRPAIRTR